MRKLLQHWREEKAAEAQTEGINEGALEAPEAPTLPEPSIPAARCPPPPPPAVSIIPPAVDSIFHGDNRRVPAGRRPAPAPGVYLISVHGHPEGKTAADWAAAGRKAIQEALRTGSPDTGSRLFAEACYYFNAARWLREKSQVEKDRMFFLVENLKYPKAGGKESTEAG